MPTTVEEFLTVEEAAAALRCAPVTIRRMVSEGRLSALRIGAGARSIRIPRGALEALAETARRGTAAGA